MENILLVLGLTVLTSLVLPFIFIRFRKHSVNIQAVKKANIVSGESFQELSSVLFYGSPLSSPINLSKEQIDQNSIGKDNENLLDYDIDNKNMQIFQDVMSGKIPHHKLESLLSPQDAVETRRKILQEISGISSTTVSNIPFSGYPYEYVTKRCCENVIGYVPIPLGFIGPLIVDGKPYFVPMATTEGALVASTQRGCKAIGVSGDAGITTVLIKDAMTRGPVVTFPCISRVQEFCDWINLEANFEIMKKFFNSTSRYARLQAVKAAPAGCEVYLRVSANTGDAMGMNMISKGCEKLLSELNEIFPDMMITSISGNYCTDKKPAAINWVDGRGKYVIASCVITKEAVKTVLKTDIDTLLSVASKKNMKGSIMAGSIGGFNAHASNMVTAIYIATGQDVAQAVVSSNCLTELESIKTKVSSTNNQLADSIKPEYALRITCTMPSIEVGTIGGGTHLPTQHACLGLLGVAGPDEQSPGSRSRKLSRIVCATVLAGELSLLAALAEGTLVTSHMNYNRIHNGK